MDQHPLKDVVSGDGWSRDLRPLDLIHEERIQTLKDEIARAESLDSDERLRQYGTEGLDLLRSALGTALKSL